VQVKEINPKTETKNKAADKPSDKTTEPEKEGATESHSVYDMMCTIKMAPVTEAVHGGCKKGRQRIILKGHQFNGVKAWMGNPAKHQPSVTLQATNVTLDYGHFGYLFDNLAKMSWIKVITDTGCQSTLMGIDMVHQLGYPEV
jgi:hypothetical protein